MFFRKSKRKKEDNILELEIGSQLEVDMKIQNIKNIYKYDWGGYESVEYVLESFGEISFLYIEKDDELFFTFLKEKKELVENIAYYIASGDDVPQEIKYKKEIYKLEEISEGMCTDKSTGKSESIFSFDYFNKERDRTISYEIDKENEITAYFGNVIYEHEINILSDNNGGNRFA